jgi:HlyD family secretion protein
MASLAIRNFTQQHRKLVWLGALAVAVLLTVGMVIRAGAGNARYLTAEVHEGNLTATVQATGTINPLTTVPVGSYVSGTVKYIFADFNTRVQAEQVLAQLDPAIYQAQVIQARGNLANAQANVANLEASIAVAEAVIHTNQANLEKAKAAVEYTRANNQRIANLAGQGILSRDQADQTQSTLDQANAAVRAADAQLNQSAAQLNQTKAQLAQAKAQVQTMTGALKQSETNLHYTTILSPINGTIVARNVDVGQSVAASLQAPVVFSIAQDLKRMQVYAKVDESDTGNIRIGTLATFQVDAFPNERFQGRVSAIRLNATIVQNVVTYDTVIDFENPDEKLLPGQTAYVAIPTGHCTGCVKIPNAALRFTPDMPRKKLQELYDRYRIPAEATRQHIGGTQVVWMPGKDNKPKPLAVKVGITDYSYTQMLEGNLKANDVLITGEEIAQGNRSQGTFPGNQRAGGQRR